MMAALTIDNIDRGKWAKFLTHLIVIGMLFVLPELLFSYTMPEWKSTPLITFSLYLKPAIFAALFYVNYFFIIPHTIAIGHRRIWWFLGMNLLLICAALVIFYLVQYMANEPMQAMPHKPMRRHPPRFEDRTAHILRNASFWIRDGGMLVLTIALAVALKLGETWSMMTQRHKEMLATQRNEELQSLKSQLNPHFLFNSLNTIYALIQVSPDEAQDAVHRLSTLLRYVLYENPQKVDLSKEIAFAQNYISLMEMRMGAGSVKANFAELSASPVQVPPLIFITLIENAFKHGNTGSKEHPIEISIESTADGTVICRTFNHYVSRPGAETPSKDGGIGISNLRRRLQLIYGSHASLSTDIKGDTYTAILTIHTSDKQISLNS